MQKFIYLTLARPHSENGETLLEPGPDWWVAVSQITNFMDNRVWIKGKKDYIPVMECGEEIMNMIKGDAE